MTRRLPTAALTASLFLLAGAMAMPAADPPAPPPRPIEEKAGPKADPAPVPAGRRSVDLPGGGKAGLVPREQLRIRAKDARTLVVPLHLKAAAATLPSVPPTFDWTKNNTISFPILGNDAKGDCYYAAMCHAFQAWNANARTPVAFDAAAVLRRYAVLSRGDNGLSDSDVFGAKRNGEFYTGVVGPNGPHKIVDHLMVDPADDAGTALSMWAFGGLVYTAALPDKWVANIKPGMLWDKGVPDQRNGHAIVLTGKNPDGTYSLQTWGLNPPVRVTPAGIKSSDPELIVCFSLEWFDPASGKAPNGMTYDELAALWQTLGGRALPPNPFGPAPPPVPPVPPVNPPVPGKGFTGSLVYADGVLTHVVQGAVGSDAAIKAELHAAGVSPLVIADLARLVADVRAKKPLAVIVADAMKVIEDLSKP